MNTAVTRLMGLADEYAIAYHLANPKDRQRWLEMAQKRQVLQAELTRLFTPLSDEQITKSVVKSYQFGHQAFAREIESWHGITGE